MSRLSLRSKIVPASELPEPAPTRPINPWVNENHDRVRKYRAREAAAAAAKAAKQKRK